VAAKAATPAAAPAAPAARPAAPARPAASGGGGPLDRTPDMEGLSASERAKIYKERAAAAGIGRAPQQGG
jgi:hypothetical protein